MTRRTAFACSLVASVCLAAIGGARAQGPPDGGAPTDVVATVGDTPLFRSELDAVVNRAAAGTPLHGGLDGNAGPDNAVGRRPWIEAVAIEQLVDERLLRREIGREQITVNRLDVDSRLEQLKKQVVSRGGEWKEFLAQASREESAVRAQIELEIALDKLIRPKLTAATIAAGFERHRRDIDGTRLRVSHIVLRPDAALGDDGLAATMARLAAIRKDVVQSAMTFADAARRYSAGPSRSLGGDLGWITRDGPFLEAFLKQAFALAKGDVSKPFITPFGVHIVQVTAIDPGTATLESLRPKIESLLAGNLLRETLTRLRATTPVSYGAGVSHFDPATPADGDRPRRIVVGDPSGPVSGPPTP